MTETRTSLPTKYLGKTLTIQIDRPSGSRHPDWSFLYALSYGYLPGTRAPNGEEIDAYLLGVFEPLDRYQGRCIAILHRRDDDNPKLVLAPPGKCYHRDQILALVEVQERFFETDIITWESV